MTLTGCGGGSLSGVLSGPIFFRVVAASVCLAGLAAPACAMERVTLRNGMTLDCARHENLGDQVRLFSGHGREYQDVSFLQIVSIDYVPDALAAPKAAAAKANVPAKPARVMAFAPTTPKPSATAKPVPTVIAAAPAKLAPAASKPVPLFVPQKPVAAPAFTAAVTAVEPGFPELEVHELLQQAGTTYNIDAELLASIIQAESGGNARATSRYGARGLMQLMPSVGRTYGANDLYRPEQNVTAGTALLDALLRKYNDNLPLALAAYNAGPGAVQRWHGVPPSARGYVGRVMNEFRKRKLALGAKPSVAPAQAVKPVEVASAPVAQAAPSRRKAHFSSIHREWSGQQAFASR